MENVEIAKKERPLVPNQDKIEQIEFKVRGRVEGNRIDAYLSKRFNDYSRAYLQKLIKAGNVLIDGKKAKASDKIKDGQIVSIALPELEPLHLKPEEMTLNIIYEDDDIAVLNKPADLVVHPSRGHMQGTLVNGLLYHFENLSDENDVYRPGIVHRLDRFTSGILLIAKNNKSHASLGEQFENRKIQKQYFALIEGHMRFEQGTIALPLAMDPRNRERMAISHGGKEAVTNYSVFAKYPHFSLIHVFPKTGRTHQIRIHLKSQGCPIVADSLYDAPPLLTWERIKQDAIEIPENLTTLDQSTVFMERTALHAWNITFEHPTSKEICTFHAPFPEDYATTLKIFNTIWPCKNVTQLLEQQ